jgi:hypothetical protein
MASKIDQETDARFWSQSGYKPGQKLDPSDPTDAKMIPVWKDINAKVKREADAGKLVTTYDHPVVVQNLADAHVADQAAVVHVDAAAAAPDPQTAQQHIAAATNASEVAAQKMHEAATLQPPTVSPQLAHEASQQAQQDPPHPSAPAKDQIANAQAQAAHKPSPRGILDKETNARFWAQTNFKPGQKLDPKNPTDAAMMPVWKDIFAKVKREDDDGKLVLTYNHPVVATNLADAHVADQAAAMHVDAAAAAPNPQAAQQNVAAAAIAAQIAAQKTRDAARLQPPTVSPQLAHESAQRARPPGTSARSIQAETDARFWAKTHYKPGQRLNPRDPKDAAMIPVWMDIYAKVSQEAAQRSSGRDHLAHEQARTSGHRAAGVHHDARHRPPVRSATSPHKVKDHRERATRLAHESGADNVLVVEKPDGTMDHRTFATRAELDAEYAKLSEHHDQYKYMAEFALGENPNAPVVDSVGIPAAEHADVPPAPDPSTEMVAPVPAPEGKPLEEPPPEEKPAWSIGKIVAVGLAVAAAGGIVYMATRKPSRSSAAWEAAEAACTSSPRKRTSKAAPMRLKA